MIEKAFKKQLVVVGGPNGSGKSTLAREILQEKDITYISADDIAYELNPSNPEKVSINEFHHDYLTNTWYSEFL